MVIDPQTAAWLRDEQAPMPDRAVLSRLVKESARTLEKIAPGKSVEVRIPPFVAVQCVEGLTHRRGTPPNIVELPPRQWLRLAAGLIHLDELENTPKVTISGTRAKEIARWMPLLHLPAEG
ncbi:MAG: sterol carrier family protein [Corynebacterium sp.]|nr:sterol carrier family protein [Corynebacterium sp.]